jgi:hypothetical protein
MPRTPNAPVCPSADELLQLISFVEDVKKFDEEADYQLGCAKVVIALEWLETFLSNRKLYHKKVQLKNKIIRHMLEEQIGPLDQSEDLKHATNAALEDHVVNS